MTDEVDRHDLVIADRRHSQGHPPAFLTDGEIATGYEQVDATGLASLGQPEDDLLLADQRSGACADGTPRETA
jgi:hypothetical protein